MKIHRSAGYIHIDFTGAEAAAFLEELENVRGGSKLPKVKQVCTKLRALTDLWAPVPPKPAPKLPLVRLLPVPDEEPPCES